MFIFSQFCTSVTTLHKPSMPQHSNKNILVQIDQSLECVAIHTGAYVRAYGMQRRDSNVKTLRKGENKLLNIV